MDILDAAILSAVDNLRIKQKTAYFPVLSITKYVAIASASWTLPDDWPTVLSARLQRLSEDGKLRVGDSTVSGNSISTKYGLGLSLIRALGEHKRKLGIGASGSAGMDIFLSLARMSVYDIEKGFCLDRETGISTATSTFTSTSGYASMTSADAYQQAYPYRPLNPILQSPFSTQDLLQLGEQIESLIAYISPNTKDLFITAKLINEADDRFKSERKMYTTETELLEAEERLLRNCEARLVSLEKHLQSTEETQ